MPIPNNTSSESSRRDGSKADLFGTDTVANCGDIEHGKSAREGGDIVMYTVVEGCKGYYELVYALVHPGAKRGCFGHTRVSAPVPGYPPSKINTPLKYFLPIISCMVVVVVVVFCCGETAVWVFLSELVGFTGMNSVPRTERDRGSLGEPRNPSKAVHGCLYRRKTVMPFPNADTPQVINETPGNCFLFIAPRLVVVVVLLFLPSTA